MKGALAMDTLFAIPEVENWLELVQPAVEKLKSEGKPPELKSLTAENALLQLDNLKFHPVSAARLGTKELSLHAWIYQIDCGDVRCSPPRNAIIKRLPSTTVRSDFVHYSY